MHKVYIPYHPEIFTNKQRMLVLVRPFFDNQRFGNTQDLLIKWGLRLNEIAFTGEIEDADIVLFPFPIQDYLKKGYSDFLLKIGSTAKKLNIPAYIFIAGDFGAIYPIFDNLYFLRLGGFKQQFGENTKILAPALSDQLQYRFNRNSVFIRPYTAKPTIGFCGHADDSFTKKLKEKLKFLSVNILRFLSNPKRSDYEPLFASAFERSKLLRVISNSDKVQTNFLLRNHYRGSKDPDLRDKTTVEYYKNMIESDYIFCLRGGGNFSVRLYEALMMGRIPVMVDTDCQLPFEDSIDWNDHIIKIPWERRTELPEVVQEFHSNLNEGSFKAIQLKNRSLWQEKLTPAGMLRQLFT